MATPNYDYEDDMFAHRLAHTIYPSAPVPNYDWRRDPDCALTQEQWTKGLEQVARVIRVFDRMS